MAGPVLAAHGLVKTFPGVVALADVSFELRPGEIHAICGENGAGKSTLIKILGGIHPHGSYQGEVLVDGVPARFRQSADAQAAGIGVIHQELALVSGLTVAENIALGQEPRRGWFLDNLATEAAARGILGRLGLAIDPSVRVGSLGIGSQQLVEISRALGRRSRILILDEPTAALSGREVDLLLGILRDLRQQGISCIYISHKLDEVFAIADRLTVLRDGRTISTLDVAGTDKATVIRHMVGREISEFYPRTPSPPGDDLLRVRDLGADPRDGDGVHLRDISFNVRAGEVLGIGGLMGAGRSELLLHLFGAWGDRRQGTVELLGRPFPDPTPTEAIARGMVMVTEDRKRLGLVMGQSIGFNLSLSCLADHARWGLIDPDRESVANRDLARRLGIKAPDIEARTSTLSGGNQQKVVLGKALSTTPRVILLDEPTRGIDVAAKLEIYGLINGFTAAGNGVILVSSELPELMGMSDRILMLGEGRVGGLFQRGACSADDLISASLTARRMAQEATAPVLAGPIP